MQEVYLDWPPTLNDQEFNGQSCALTNQDKMDRSEPGLAELYEQGLKLMQEAEKLPRGDKRQDTYINSRKCFEKAAELVESLSIFSSNETVDDIATADLRYLLVPAYLAKVFVSSECSSHRLEVFEKAESWIVKFLTRIVQYGLGDTEVKRSLEQALQQSSDTTRSQVDLKSAMLDRESKIEKYKKMKLLEDRLSELERQVKVGQEVDDEVKREYYLQLIKKWIDDTHECLEREVRPALFFERGRPDKSAEELASSVKSEPQEGTSKGVQMKPFTIVKTETQKQVFGLGYPSMPTFTVDEFISKKINDGELAFQAQKEVYANSLQRYAEQPNLMREQEEESDTEREAKEEREDQDELKRKRNWDNFKDENPRGSGNRHNMG